jgi:hypothetical protein
MLVRKRPLHSRKTKPFPVKKHKIQKKPTSAKNWTGKPLIKCYYQALDYILI